MAGAAEGRFTAPVEYSGMCDASGAVAVTTNLFLVASDEDNTLRLYRADRPGPPVQSFDLDGFLELHGKSREADLEGAALIGRRAFWIGSHGRNKDGKDRPNRQRLIATDLQVTADGKVAVQTVGRPYKDLLRDLAADGRFAEFHLSEAARIAPKESGALNIEGLSATPEGHLLIGFRNPIPDGQALLVPLVNPDEVIAGRAGKFGAPIRLNLGGVGIRDIAWHPGGYRIIAGSYHGSGKFQIYRWAGPGAAVETVPAPSLKGLTPEGIVIYPQRGWAEIQILSDDGTRMVDGAACKDCPDEKKKTFRSFWLSP